MKQRTAILLALGLTVFVLVIAGAIVMSLQAQAVAKTVSAQTADNSDQAVQNISAQIGTAPTAAPTFTSSPAPSATPPPTDQPTVTDLALASAVPITPDRALRIALALKPGYKARRVPELVNYRGKMAYEVVLNTAYVYVDAFQGQILAQVPIVIPSPTPTEVVPTPQPTTDTSGSSSGSDNGGGNGGGGNGGGHQTQPPPPPPPPPPGPKPKQHHEKEHEHGDSGVGSNLILHVP